MRLDCALERFSLIELFSSEFGKAKFGMAQIGSVQSILPLS